MRNAYLNNLSQVLTSGGLLFTLGDEEGAVDLDIDATYRGINDLGLICGSRQVAAKANKTNDVGYIYDVLSNSNDFIDLSSLSSAVHLNSNADVIGYKTIRKNIFVGDNTRPTLVHAHEGVIDLDSEGVVVFTDETDQTAWENSSFRTPLLVSERDIVVGADEDAKDFPVIVGYMTHPDTYFYYMEMYIMRPVPVIQP